MSAKHPAAASRIRTGTLADQVYGLVRSRILAGELAPSQFVRESELEALGVSRTPIRDALARLASEGFLERLPRRGFRVPAESVGGLLELYPIVAALDLLAGRLAVGRFGPGDLARLAAANDALLAARDRGDVNGMIDANNQFHGVFAECSANQRLRALLEDLRSQLGRLERWYYSQSDRATESIREHDEIILALRAGDSDHALGVLERNMSLTYRRLVESAPTAV